MELGNEYRFWYLEDLTTMLTSEHAAEKLVFGLYTQDESAYWKEIDSEDSYDMAAELIENYESTLRGMMPEYAKNHAERVAGTAILLGIPFPTSQRTIRLRLLTDVLCQKAFGPSSLLSFEPRPLLSDTRGPLTMRSDAVRPKTRRALFHSDRQTERPRAFLSV